jgi:hypothetical protein
MYVPGRDFLGVGRYSGRSSVATLNFMSGSFPPTSETESVDVVHV